MAHEELFIQAIKQMQKPRLNSINVEQKVIAWHPDDDMNAKLVFRFSTSFEVTIGYDDYKNVDFKKVNEAVGYEAVSTLENLDSPKGE